MQRFLLFGRWHQQTPVENAPYVSLTFNKEKVFSCQKRVEHHLKMDHESEVSSADTHFSPKALTTELV